jgi:hypothetical protein
MSMPIFSRLLHFKAGGFDTTEFGIRVASVALAGGSMTFAAVMIADSERQPRVTGVEYLSIFSKPALLAAQRAQQQQASEPQIVVAEKTEPEIDYTPIGTVPDDKRAETPINGFKLLEASGDSALIRGPRGSSMRVWKGDVIDGVGRVVSIEKRGDRWAVVTSNGLITQK